MSGITPFSLSRGVVHQCTVDIAETNVERSSLRRSHRRRPFGANFEFQKYMPIFREDAIGEDVRRKVTARRRSGFRWHAHATSYFDSANKFCASKQGRKQDNSAGLAVLSASEAQEAACAWQDDGGHLPCTRI